MTLSAPRRRVILHSGEDDLLSAAHDRASRNGQADRIAALLTESSEDQMPYVVPSDTLSLETAATLGIERAEDFFGGAVPLPFVGTKAVSHGLAFRGAKAPTGWNPDLGEALAEMTLPGFTAFSVSDAREAGFRLLASGPVRLKDVHAVAGLGQTAVSTPAELISALTARDPEAIARHGLVLEENLMDHETLSVGSVQVGHRRVSYWGVQRTVVRPDGREVYGGSDLQAAAGGYEDLLTFDLPAPARIAVTLARAWEAAVFDAYPGVIASRRNYDVIFGANYRGDRRAVVLEQSWRIGGASGAEIAALEVFSKDRSAGLVRTSTMEIPSIEAQVPAHAVVYFRGVDERAGPLTKYAVVHP